MVAQMNAFVPFFFFFFWPQTMFLSPMTSEQKEKASPFCDRLIELYLLPRGKYVCLSV